MTYESGGGGKIRVLSFPNPHDGLQVGGIATVVKKYLSVADQSDIDFVKGEDYEFDLIAVHAGMVQPTIDVPFVAHSHGLYWTDHYDAEPWEQQANKYVMANVRRANLVTVPSEWVAQTFRRDMHLDPVVLPHAVDCDEWVPLDWEESSDYVLWNKNRDTDACTTRHLQELAALRGRYKFVSTFGVPSGNLRVIRPRPYDEMREIVRHCGVYLNTTEETFGIGILEAMASGKPILAYDFGGASELVQHQVNGYLAEPENYEDLAAGLDYCMQHRRELGENSRELAKLYSWGEVGKLLHSVYSIAVDSHRRPRDIAVVIPCYNKASTLERAVLSVLRQTRPASEIIIVDNNSRDDSRRVADELARNHQSVTVINCDKQGVAHARNYGVHHSRSRYICCLDADDEIGPTFLEVTAAELDKPDGADLAYTKLLAVSENGVRTVSDWPDEYDPRRFFEGANQVPTCCLFRRDVFERLGGYRQRYAPDGAGAEDAELWLRMLKHGYMGKLVSREPLFIYHLGGQVAGNPEYREVDWRYFHRGVGVRGTPLGSGSIYNVPIRKYNQTDVSVVIPCTDDHIQYLWDVLDSLEGQTFPFWEAIVVMDGEYNQDEADRIWRAFPFIKRIDTRRSGAYDAVGRDDNGSRMGAGAARNAGVSIAESPFILFVDADDWLTPECIEKMVNAADANPGEIIYSDYIGRAFGVTNPDHFARFDRLVHYDPRDQFAIIRYKAFEYDCETAQKQPEIDQNGQFYIWNLVSSLVPIEHHEDIGGFDENMLSWEDWDYWIRMARHGVCFHHIKEELVSYRFYTGSRREIGRQRAQKLLDYLRLKYEGEPLMACGGCGKKSRSVTMTQPENLPPIASYSPNEMVRVEFLAQTFGEPISVRDHDTNQLHDYGYRKTGDRFLMLRKHAAVQPSRYKILEPEPVKAKEQESAPQDDVGKVASKSEPKVEPVDDSPPAKKVTRRPTRGRSKSTRSSSS